MGSLLICHITLRGEKPNPTGYPKAPKTLGEALKKRRMDLGSLQREVATKLGVNEASVWNWEKGRTAPAKRFITRIRRFLG